MFRLFRPQKSGAEIHHQNHHKAVCSSVVRTLHRLGMSGRAEIKPFGDADRPAMFITVDRAVVKLSQAAMGMLSKEIVAHAKRKYATEIASVYWRIEADFEADDELAGEVLGPSTLGYLVDESSDRHQLASSLTPTPADTLDGVDPVRVGYLARRVRASIDRRRHERGMADFELRHTNTHHTEEVSQ